MDYIHIGVYIEFSTIGFRRSCGRRCCTQLYFKRFAWSPQSWWCIRGRNAFPSTEHIVAIGEKRIHAWLDLLSITWSPKGCKFFHIWSCFLLLISFVQRARERHLSVGHNYNIMDINERKIVTVETASNARSSTRNIAMEPFFHANMYLHLQVPQVLMGYGIARGGPFFLFLS